MPSLQRGTLVSFVLGFLSLALILLLLGADFVAGGFSVRAKPTRAESALARFALSHSVSQADRALRNPVEPSQQSLAEARDHFADHCALCHANNGDDHTMYGDGLNPAPPDLRLAATQSKTDGELYSIIQNGVRMTGMPAFGALGTNDESTWKLVALIRHLPALTPAELLAMEKANPISPSELQERQQEDDFLSGGPPPGKGKN
jgi:mono/diheme cytochrome c family protein